jgi:hypothetical protein
MVKKMKKIRKFLIAFSAALIVSLLPFTTTFAHMGHGENSSEHKVERNKNVPVHYRKKRIHRRHEEHSSGQEVNNTLVQIKGESIQMGHGELWSWLEVDEDKNPTAIGLSFTASAMSHLPAEDDPGGIPHADGNHPSFEYELSLPEEASKTAFKHIVVNWNPTGHHPEEFFGPPHFDFHFYTISSKERHEISTQNPAIFDYPDKAYWASDYLPAVAPPELAAIGVVGSETDKMGLHWYDPTSSPYNGELPFTETFFFGSYDKKFTFWEPMVNKSYLDTFPNITKDIKLPKAYSESGYYPTQYSINYDKTSGVYTIALKGSIYREATTIPESNPTFNH